MTTHAMPVQSIPPPASPAGIELDLMDGDRPVGWITDRIIGFRGFGTPSEAAHAAWIAYRAIARRLARGSGDRMIPIDIEPLSLVREGQAEFVYAGHRRIARLVRAEEDHLSAAGEVGFELQLERSDELTARALAHVTYRGLRRSGVRWSMLQPPLPTPAPAKPVKGRATALSRWVARTRGEGSWRRLWPRRWSFAAQPIPAMEES